MKTAYAFAAVAALLIAAPSASFAASVVNNSDSVSASAKSFLTDAIKGDASEIKLGQLAEKNGGSSGVKDFGKTLVTDHTKAEQQAKATAEQVGVNAPAEPTNSAQQEYDKLAKMKGADFDKEFVSHMVKDHKKDIANFQKQADAKNGPVSQLAQQQLPTLQKHLQIAQSLQKKQQASAP